MTTQSERLIVVFGATGIQGGGVLDEFVKHPGWRIRAITRDTSSAKAQALLAKSDRIELAAADMNDISSLEAVFKDANAIFVVTDFWALHNDPANASKAKPGQEHVEWAAEAETQQGKNIFDAASKVPTLERLVFSMLANASKWSNGKYTYALHFESKALACEYGEETYPDLWAKTSRIQVGFYLENFLGHIAMAPTKNADGVFEFYGLGSAPKDKSEESNWPIVAAGPDTGRITYALVDELPAGQHVAAFREEIPLQNFVDAWSKTLNVPATLKYGGGLSNAGPPALQRELGDVMAFCREFGYWGYADTSVKRPGELGVDLGLGSVEEWIKAQDWTEVLSGKA